MRPNYIKWNPQFNIQKIALLFPTLPPAQEKIVKDKREEE